MIEFFSNHTLRKKLISHCKIIFCSTGNILQNPYATGFNTLFASFYDAFVHNA